MDKRESLNAFDRWPRLAKSLRGVNRELIIEGEDEGEEMEMWTSKRKKLLGR